MTSPPEIASAPTPAESPLRAVAEELVREDKELLLPLLARINEVADALAQGKLVDPDYIDEAVRLWNRFVSEVHQHRLERLYNVFQLLVQARGPSDRGPHRSVSRFRPSKKNEVHVETSLDKYNEIRGTQTRMEERIGVLRGLISGYRRKEYYSAQMLASLLRSGAFSDRAWAKYEEEFVQKFLDEHVAADEDMRLRSEVQASGELRDKVGTEIRQYLARPVPLLASPS
jgi:hypothetical protein